ncbi:hypothetical protein LY76DRAFT_19617 [Colletotrichum caudatum]|nr:hypothetical protein LY76DRAFT_19617 [Colletotrichum caudatum]
MICPLSRTTQKHTHKHTHAIANTLLFGFLICFFSWRNNVGREHWTITNCSIQTLAAPYTHPQSCRHSRLPFQLGHNPKECERDRQRQRQRKREGCPIAWPMAQKV